MGTKPQPRVALPRKLQHKLAEYAAVSLYMYICLATVLLYKASVLRAHGIEYAPYGLAAIKALILGKFMLIGHAMRLGEERRHTRAVFSILYKSLVFLAVLVLLSVAEAVISGLIHGRTAIAASADITGGTWFQVATSCILLWVVLLPYFAFRQINEALGEGTLRRMLLDAR